jgi:hypothetical protein
MFATKLGLSQGVYVSVCQCMSVHWLITVSYPALGIRSILHCSWCFPNSYERLVGDDGEVPMMQHLCSKGHYQWEGLNMRSGFVLSTVSGMEQDVLSPRVGDQHRDRGT